MRHRRQPRVLALDADPAVLELIASGLNGHGYDLTLGTSADDGRRALQADTFDCVMLDHGIEHGSNGVVLTELGRYPVQTVAVIMMATPSEASSIEAFGNGAYDYLAKPFAPHLLRLTVARAVERTTLARTMRELLEELDTANAELRSLTAELQSRVDAATAELQRKVRELEGARAALEEAHRQREAFIRLIAHELGAPLTAMMGYAEMLGNTELPSRIQRRARAVIVSETRRMARLLDDLTDTRQRAKADFELELRACDLAAIIQDQVELARARRGARQSLGLHLPGGPVPLLADRDRLGQIVSNLLSNALKYAPDGTISVSLLVDGAEARLSIVDDGPGIPADSLEAIFEPRVRLAAAEGQGQPSGAGLGLYVARRLAQAHGGRLWAESGPRRGATFRLCLPLASPLLRRLDPPAAPACSRTRAG